MIRFGVIVRSPVGPISLDRIAVRSSVIRSGLPCGADTALRRRELTPHREPRQAQPRVAADLAGGHERHLLPCRALSSCASAGRASPAEARLDPRATSGWRGNRDAVWYEHRSPSHATR
jgi:hypothetical protein